MTIKIFTFEDGFKKIRKRIRIKQSENVVILIFFVEYRTSFSDFIFLKNIFSVVQ